MLIKLGANCKIIGIMIASFFLMFKNEIPLLGLGCTAGFATKSTLMKKIYERKSSY